MMTKRLTQTFEEYASLARDRVVPAAASIATDEFLRGFYNDGVVISKVIDVIRRRYNNFDRGWTRTHINPGARGVLFT